MNKRIWKIEYSITIIAIFAAILFMIPTSFSSRVATYISRWNSEYNKIEYMFSAISAQADSDIVQNFKNNKTGTIREKHLINLIKPYLRLSEPFKRRRYVQHYMNGKTVSKNDKYYFDSLYQTHDGLIIGIKDIKNTKNDLPIFIMMIDTNGHKRPNVWGKDIFGLNIYIDGNVSPIGYGWEVEVLRKDCSKSGTGLSCSHFYRIGGEFIE